MGGAGPAGLRDRVARASEQQTLETLQGLADDTGGFLVRGDPMRSTPVSLRMLQDNESVYLLAYEPTNQKHDGRFRKLAVRLPRHRDYVVRTRRGYFAPDAKRRAQAAKRSARLPLSAEAAQAALGAPPPSGGLPVRVAADYVELTPGGPHAVVKAQVDPSGLVWQKVDGRQRAEFDLVGGVYDASGAPGPLVRRPALRARRDAGRLRIAEGDGGSLRGERALEAGAVRDPDARARLGARAARRRRPADRGSRRRGEEAHAQQRVPVVGRDDGRGHEAEAPRDAQVLRRFKTSDTLYFQLYVYNASRDGAGVSDVVLQAQIHAAGKPPFASKPRRRCLQEKDGAPLPEADGIPTGGARPPGDYELRIVVADRKASAVASRSVDFTVE